MCSLGTSGPLFVYDGDGNMTTGGTRTVSYNAQNRPSQITDTATELVTTGMKYSSR